MLMYKPGLMDETRRELSKKWRKCGRMPGRLYWRANNRRWRIWDSDDIAMAVDGVRRIHFKNLAAIREMLIEENCGER